ncbi:MAG: NYN domain-containing protein [Planctomycetota bacterium]|nr:NYN domain-containing protein [Planctomycetota bacterium]
MKTLSPDENAGNGDDLSGLQQQVERLESQLEKEREKHNHEMKRGLEAFQRLQREGSGEKKDRHLISIDGHDLSPHQRVAIFVDVQNMYYAARNIFQSKLEFSKLLRHLLRGRVLARAMAYIVERPGMEQDKFIEVLRRNGYEVRKRVVGDRNDSTNRGDWNIGITLDVLSLSSKIDVAILVTGDGDFVPLVDRLSMEGVRVEIASFRETTSSDLLHTADQMHFLDERVLLTGTHFQPAEEQEEEHEKELVPPRARKPLRRARGPVEEDFDDEEDED